MQTRESIQVRLRRIILGPSAAVVMLAIVSFLVYEIVAFRKSHRENLLTIARVVAQNSSSPLSFDIPEDATKLLASLAADPTISLAILFDEHGAIFARYAPTNAPAGNPSGPGPDRVRYEGGRLVVVLPVAEDRRMGTLYVEAGLSPLYDRLKLYCLLAAVILGCCLALAFFLSSWLQKRVTEPLLELARAAARVSRTRDYSLRVPKRTEDEVGGLTEAFNEMLAEIARRDQALRQSSERLQLALGASLTGTWDWDLRSNFITWDDHVHALFGMKPGEFSGRPEDFMARVHPGERSSLERIIRRAREKNKEFDAEYRVLWPDGSIHWMVSRGKALLDENGRPVRTTGVTIDVTQIKKAEQALRESEERFRTMADAAPVMIWTADREQQRDYFNRSWLDFTGREYEQEEGAGWFEGVHPEDRAPVSKKHADAWSQRSAFEVEYRLRRAGGEFRIVREHGAPRLTAGETFGGYIGSCIDITDIREAQVELERRVEERTGELAETNRELEAFTYSVSHDLRAPLRHINAYAEILEEDHAPSLNPEAREHLRRIRVSARNMGMLVDDLLNLARVGRQDLAVAPVSLNAVAEEAAREARQDAEKREIEWRIGELGEARCDAGLVKQVFVNLISNAVKYSRNREHAVIEIGVQTTDGLRTYYVRDNGVGFDMRFADKLFGVFQRLHRADEFEGTGVGLALVDRIVRKHGGRIWAEAKLNEGATFFFTLERSRAPRKAPGPAAV